MDEDDEFEVTAEMLIHGDVDDEQTLAEAEAEENAGDVEEEVADLQQESELPLQELLRRYGYSLSDDKSSGDPPQGVVKGEGEREAEEERRQEGGGEGNGGEEVEERDRGVKRGRIRDSLVEGDEVNSSGCVKKINIDQHTDGTAQDISLQTSAHEETKQASVEKRDSSKLELVNKTASSIEPVSSIVVAADTHSSSSSNHDFIPASNPITSQLVDPAPVLPTSPQHQSQTLPYTHPDPLLIGTNPTIPPPPPKVVPYHHSVVGIAPTLISSPSDPGILHNPVGALSEGTLLSDGEVGSSLTHESSVFLAAGASHLLLGDPMLPAGRVVEGVGRGGGGGGGGRGGGERGSGVGLGEVGGRQRDRLLSGGGEREGDRLERSPKLTDGYSSDPQSSSDTQSHTPSSSSTSLQISFSSSSSVSGGSRTGGPPHSDIKSRLRPELPERRSMRLMANDDSFFSAFFDDDEGDDEYVPVEEWKQEIRVGPSYQVQVADRPSQEPYSHPKETPDDRLLWRPRSPEDRVVSFLKTVSTVVKPESAINSRETEQAMKLLHECDHNVQRAVDMVQQQGLPSGTRSWTTQECKSFEEGLRVSGKDFFQLRKLVPSRSVKELVEFYYIWKKSKRYEDFIIQHGKIGKKKVTLQPGQVFDFMDNYLNMQDSAAPDLHYATTTVYAEHKKEAV